MKVRSSEDNCEFQPFRLKIEKKLIKKNKNSRETDSKHKNNAYFPLYIDLPILDLFESEYSVLKHTKLLGTLPPDRVVELDKLRNPQKTLEQLCQSQYKDIIFIGDPGHGKTENALLFGIDQVYGDKKKFILSFTPNRAVARTQQQKFKKLSHKLTGGQLKSYPYFYGMEDLKRLIRQGKKKFQMLLTTPLTYTGSWINFIPVSVENQEHHAEQSYQPQWAQTLSTPHILLIDEVDSFPLSMLMLMIPVVRILKWKNPFLKVILASATLGNPDEIAQRFLSSEGKYQVLKGSGRRGKIRVKVDYEEKPTQLLDEKITQLAEYIEEELVKNAKSPKYTPNKVLFFLNNKTDINRRKINQVFTNNYEIVHGSMKFEEIIKRLDRFRTNPELIVLVSTILIQAGYHLPNVRKGLSYGISEDVRGHMQRFGRFNRNPKSIGNIDVILRSYNKFERKLADPANHEELISYLTRKSPVSLEIPRYTLINLKFWITLGVLAGFPDVIERIENELSPFDEERIFQIDLQKASLDLWLQGYIMFDADNQLHPTTKTKSWILNIVQGNNEPIYNIILKTKGKKKVLGTVDYLSILRHHLKGQSFPLWWNFNTVVKEIDHDRQELIVEPTTAGYRLYRNKIKQYRARTEFKAICFQKGLAFLKVETKYNLEEVKQLKTSTRIKPPPLVHSQLAVFIGETSPCNIDKNSNNDNAWVEYLQTNLHIESSAIELQKFEDPILGEGILLIDQSNVGLASLIYEHLERKYQCNISEKVSLQDRIKNANESLKSIFPLRLKRFNFFLKKYSQIIVFIADSHLKSSYIMVNGQEIDSRTFWYYLLSHIKDAFLIVFLGDTLDRIAAIDIPTVQKQYHILLEVSRDLGISEKSVFIKGNHDHSDRFFLWQTPVNVYSELIPQITSSMYAEISHGDTKGLEGVIKKYGLTDEGITTWRIQRGIPANCIQVFGHIHDPKGSCKKQLKTLAVPSLKKYLQDYINTDLGWLGLLGFGNKYEQEDWDIAIDS